MVDKDTANMINIMMQGMQKAADLMTAGGSNNNNLIEIKLYLQPDEALEVFSLIKRLQDSKTNAMMQKLASIQDELIARAEEDTNKKEENEGEVE